MVWARVAVAVAGLARPAHRRRGWLEFEVVRRDPGPAGGSAVTIHQTAVFDPRGLGGLAYWYAIWPLHEAVFGGMLAGIVAWAQGEDGGRRASQAVSES
jgi:hypothetical protein